MAIDRDRVLAEVRARPRTARELLERIGGGRHAKRDLQGVLRQLVRSEPRADMGKHPRRTRQLQTGQRGGLPALTLPDATSGRAAHAQTRARKMAHTDRP